MTSRTAEQATRRFLSLAFQNDVGGLQNNKTSSFRVQFGSPNVDADHFHVSLFDSLTQQFVGKTFKVEANINAEVIFHSRVDNLWFVVEACRKTAGLGKEKVLSWARCQVSGLVDMATLNQGELRFTNGSARLLYVNYKCWEKFDANIVGSVELSVTAVTTKPTLLTKVVPEGVFTTNDFVSLDDELKDPFSVRVKNAKLIPIESDAKAGKEALVDRNYDWQIVCLGHNRHVEFGVGMSGLPLAFRAGNMTSSNNTSIEVPRLPVHHHTSLVLCIQRRQRGVAANALWSIYGYAVMPLCPSIPDLRNCDYAVAGIPVVTGPFTTTDTRFVSLDTKQRYTRLPINVSFDLGFYNTPRPGEMVAKSIVDQRKTSEPKKAVSIETSAKTAPAATVAEEDNNVESVSDTPPAQQPKKLLPPHLRPKSSGLPTEETVADAKTPATMKPTEQPKPTTTTVQQPASTVPTTVEAKPDPKVYELLFEISNELNNLKEQLKLPQVQQGTAEEIIAARMKSAEAAQNAKKKIALEQPEDVEVVDINPLRTTIKPTARGKMVQGLPPLMHPVRNTRLVGGEASSIQLPISQLGIRFEGITVNPGFSVPLRLTARLSYASLPELKLGPLTLVKAESDPEMGTTFSLCTDNQRGHIWMEPTIEEQLGSDLTPESVTKWKQYRQEATLYIHLYDAASNFYFSTATIPTSKFRRSAGLAATVNQVDFTTYWDASLSGTKPNHTFFPLLATSGQLHVTLLNIGHTTPVEPRASMAVKQGTGNTVVAKRLHVDFGEGGTGFDEKSAVVAAPTGGAAPKAAALTNPQRNLHVQRANFVKNLLSDETARKKLLGERVVSQSTDMEFKLKFAERRRDEIKASKIAEVLRQRVTEKHKMCTYRSKPDTLKVTFTNPFPQTITFHIDIPQQSTRWLHIHSSCPLVLSLGPKETITIPAVIRVDEVLPSNNVDVSFAVMTEKGETVKIVEINVQLLKPVINRRYTINGPRGVEVKQSFYARTFSSTMTTDDEGNEQALEDIYERVGRLCTFARFTDESVRVQTVPNIDPITQSKVVSWETVEVTARIPDTTNEKEVLVFLYRDEGCTSLWETWAITLQQASMFETDRIYFGQTNMVTVLLDQPIDAGYVNDSQVEVLSPSGPSASRELTLKIKPREYDVHQPILIHTRIGDQFGKVVCSVPVVKPDSSKVRTARHFMTEADAAYPQDLSFTFINHELRHMAFHVESNYKTQLHIHNRKFRLGPHDNQKVRMTVSNLRSGRYPLWICINDENDKTVEAVAMDLVVGSGLQPHM